MSCIFLSGMPGAGKTYWGYRLASSQKLNFVDLDAFIEKREGKTIGEIFGTFGETGFRMKETAALQDVIRSSGDPAIVACGGGTPVHNGNLEIMKSAGCVIYLRAELSTLAQRLVQEEHQRPLLTGKSFLLPTLQQMLAERQGFYEQADYIFDVENISEPRVSVICR